MPTKLPVAQSSGEAPLAEPFDLAALVDYQAGAVVSRTLARTKGGTLTLFAFDQGQGLSEHTAPFHAFVQILDGSAELMIGETSVVAKVGQTVVMPAQIPHALHATERFKMLLSMVRE